MKTIKFNEFMSGEYKKKEKKLDPISPIIVGGLVVGFVILTGFDVSAASGIDEGMTKMYSKLLNVGKWFIIIKGGFDIINSMMMGDFHSVKRGALGYLLIYATLQALPWGMNQIDEVFSTM